MDLNNSFDVYCSWLKDKYEHIGIEGTSSQFQISTAFFYPHGISTIKSEIKTSFDIVV